MFNFNYLVMAQKFIKSKNNNRQSLAYGKYFATAVYDEKFITTEQIADFIQQQCSIKKSDIKAALDELGQECSEDEIRLVRIKFISEMAN